MFKIDYEPTMVQRSPWEIAIDDMEYAIRRREKKIDNFIDELFK